MDQMSKWIIIFFLVLIESGCKDAETDKQDHPNIIYILADDPGYGDLSFLGQESIKTPNIDRLSREGMTFTRHYAGAPVCAPSRCSLLTGKHTGHTVVRGNTTIDGIGVAPLSDEVITLPETIKVGTEYTTAMCGRWHLGVTFRSNPFSKRF